MTNTLHHEVAIFGRIEPFANLLKKDPDKAIEMIPDVYNGALNEAYSEDGENLRSSMKANTGVTFEAIPWALYNAVGSAYPNLSREQKDRAVKKIGSILCELNSDEIDGKGRMKSLGQMTGIKEPLLLSDIVIRNPRYWPGLREGKKKIKRHSSFPEFRRELIDENGMFKPNKKGYSISETSVNSDFLVAYALLRSDLCDWGEQYVKTANPEFLERTFKAIIALRFADCMDSAKGIRRGAKRLIELLPRSLHHGIESVRRRADWIH